MCNFSSNFSPPINLASNFGAPLFGQVGTPMDETCSVSSDWCTASSDYPFGRIVRSRREATPIQAVVRRLGEKGIVAFERGPSLLRLFLNARPPFFLIASASASTVK